MRSGSRGDMSESLIFFLCCFQNISTTFTV